MIAEDGSVPDHAGADLTPVACDLTALDPAQRARRAVLAERLRASLREVVELPGGYAYHLAGDPDLPPLVDELVGLERRCCPFLSFRVQPDDPAGAVVLEIGGGPGVKSFVAEQFGTARRPAKGP